MNRILCSTGAVCGRRNNNDITLLQESSEKLNCAGFELVMTETYYERIDDIVEWITERAIPIPAFHCQKKIGQFISRNDEGDLQLALEIFELNCRFARAIKSETLVLHLWSGIESDRDINNNIAAYPLLKTIADKYMLDLTIENVVCNNLDPMSHMKTLARAYPDIHFTFDTKIAAFHSQLYDICQPENLWLWRNITHLHINDYGGGHMEWANLRTLPMGRGNIDFSRFFETVRNVGYCGDFTVEASAVGEDGVVDFDILNQEFAMINELRGRV